MARRENEIYVRVANALDSLAKNPFQGKPLKDTFKGRFSYRVGSYRIVYSLYRETLTILVIGGIFIDSVYSLAKFSTCSQRERLR